MNDNSSSKTGSAHGARTIGISLLVALGIAVVVLVTIIWPAEYGKDPTGVGEVLGLMTMTPETETVVEAAIAEPVVALVPAVTQGEKVIPISVPAMENMEVASRFNIRPRAAAYRNDMADVTLKSGEWVEYKADMFEGDAVLYTWTASGGEIYTDVHAEPTVDKESYPEKYWLRYEESETTEGHGLIIAPFRGNHGWYWLNRNREPVSVHVEISGYYNDFGMVGGSTK